MIKEKLESWRSPRGMFFSLIFSVGLLALMTALCVFLLTSGEGESKSSSFFAIGHWFNNTLINVGAGLIIVVILATMTRVFHLQEHSAAGDLDGYQLIEKWRDERPHPTEFKKLFTNATEVQIVGVTLNHTFIHSHWFCEVLATRLKEGKKTQFLLLDPDGNELSRREREGRGRALRARAINTREQIHIGLDMAGVRPSERKNYYLTYDFAPPANVLRFGKKAYVVLFMHGEGDHSPALILSGDSFLFRCYQQHFERMWADQLKSSS